MQPPSPCQTPDCVAWPLHVNAVKTYRDILTTDVIHIRRPDGQGLDAFMHAGPQLPAHQGFALVFNPTLTNITAPLTFPLYYTGALIL